MAFSIETTALTKIYHQRPVVDRLDLRVEAGSFYGFLGPNGAGKSTTIKMLTGLIAPDQGQARLLGQRIDRKPLEIKRRIGVVPEDLGLFESLTAREYLVFVGRMYRMPSATALQRSDELLEWLGLDDTGKTLTMEFSHGMKKKLSLAAALIHDPELIFLDEPFEGIDAIAARTIRGVLGRLVERGATIFLTSHILEIVEKLCTHVGIIHEGRLVEQGTLQEVAGSHGLEEVFVTRVGQQGSAGGLSWLGNAGG